MRASCRWEMLSQSTGPRQMRRGEGNWDFRGQIWRESELPCHSEKDPFVPLVFYRLTNSQSTFIILNSIHCNFCVPPYRESFENPNNLHCQAPFISPRHMMPPWYLQQIELLPRISSDPASHLASAVVFVEFTHSFTTTLCLQSANPFWIQLAILDGLTLWTSLLCGIMSDVSAKPK